MEGRSWISHDEGFVAVEAARALCKRACSYSLIGPGLVLNGTGRLTMFMIVARVLISPFTSSPGPPSSPHIVGSHILRGCIVSEAVPKILAFLAAFRICLQGRHKGQTIAMVWDLVPEGNKCDVLLGAQQGMVEQVPIVVSR